MSFDVGVKGCFVFVWGMTAEGALHGTTPFVWVDEEAIISVQHASGPCPTEQSGASELSAVAGVAAFLGRIETSELEICV